MSRINTNVPSIIAQRVLGLQNSRLSKALERLSTGLKINRGKDDPAGLIASEWMRAELRAIEAAERNVTRASQVVSVAESGLNEIAELMKDLEELVDLSSNETALTEDEVTANQLQIDSILESIDRIATTTQLMGRRLINGDLAYTTSSVSSSQVADVHITSTRIPNGGNRSVTVEVAASAQVGTIVYNSGTITGSSRTIEVIGNLGTERLTFGSGATVSAIANAVNQSTNLTGVSARASGANYVVFSSTEYGSSKFVRVRSLTGASFNVDKPEDFGGDAIVSINGIQATADGLNVSIRSSSLSADITMTEGFGTQTAASATFYITGGGANFTITPTLDLASRAPIGIDAVTTTRLGDGNVGFLYELATGGTNALKTRNFFDAQRIVRTAARQVASLRGRLGAFERDTLDTTLNALKVEFENVSAAESSIRDADFAIETSNLTRQQILVQSAQLVLQRANVAPQNVLSLLQ